MTFKRHEMTFNLSDLKTNTASYNYGTDCYLEEDVKEFIRLLKETYLYFHEGNRNEKLMLDAIDKLAGDKLK